MLLCVQRACAETPWEVTGAGFGCRISRTQLKSPEPGTHCQMLSFYDPLTFHVVAQ